MHVYRNGNSAHKMGVMSLSDARSIAHERNLSLTCVASRADPPVYKMVRYTPRGRGHVHVLRISPAGVRPSSRSPVYTRAVQCVLT